MLSTNEETDCGKSGTEYFCYSKINNVSSITKSLDL